MSDLEQRLEQAKEEKSLMDFPWLRAAKVRVYFLATIGAIGLPYLLVMVVVEAGFDMRGLTRLIQLIAQCAFLWLSVTAILALRRQAVDEAMTVFHRLRTLTQAVIWVAVVMLVVGLILDSRDAVYRIAMTGLGIFAMLWGFIRVYNHAIYEYENRDKSADENAS